MARRMRAISPRIAVVSDAAEASEGGDRSSTDVAPDSKKRAIRRSLTSLLAPMPEHIDDFIQIQKSPDQMTFLELRVFVARLRESGAWTADAVIGAIRAADEAGLFLVGVGGS